MREKPVQYTAKLLRILVYIVLGCNVVCLPLVPYFVLMSILIQSLKVLTVPYAIAMIAFFWICGCCTAVILWQAKRILDTILAGEPFQMANAVSMNRAAAACWVISAVALVRFVAETVILWNPVTVFTYNTLFIPCFFMAGLLFRVMAALFRQAAELQEDQDLTI